MTLPGRWSPVTELRLFGDRREPAGRDEPGQERRVVDDRVVPAELAVLVADGVEAVRAGCDDRPLAHPVLVERLDVAHREHLEDVVVAHPTGGIAGARLLLAEDRESHAGGVQARRDRPRDLLVARVECGRATDPVQDIELVEPAVGRHRGDGRDLERQRRGPVEPCRRRLSPRDCPGSPSTGTRRSARSGSGSPRAPDCAAARRSCRRAR